MSDEDIKVRGKHKHFRALVLGRANAGKTTILKAVCNSTENPRIYDSRGNEIDRSIIAPTSERGEHDINNELRFSSNKGFVFHDSRGFEAGSVGEVEIMKKFIEERTNATSLDKQLHAIWYCIPVDNARLLTAAELEFFDKCDPKGVPVIVVFTKFDSRDAAAYNNLLSNGLSPEEAETRFQQAAEDEFREVELPRIRSRKFPPTGTVFLRDMNMEGASCANLIEQTTGALGTDTLKMLLVSVQRTNLKLCVRYVLESDGLCSRLKDSARKKHLEDEYLQVLVKSTISWFPHTWWNDDFEYEEEGRGPYVDAIKQYLRNLTEFRGLPLDWHCSPFLRVISVCCAILISIEHSFSIQTNQPTPEKFRDSLQRYVQSDTLVKVNKAVLDMAADICVDLSCSDHFPLPHPPSPPSPSSPPSSPIPPLPSPPSPPLRSNRLSRLLSKLLRRPRPRVVPGMGQPHIAPPPPVSPPLVSEDTEQPHIVKPGSIKQSSCHAGHAFTKDDVMKLYPIVVDNFLPRPSTS